MEQASRKLLAQYEIIVGTVWPHLRAKVRRRRLKKATPAGPKKEAPGGQIRPPRGSISRPGESQTGFWRPPGASWAPGRPQEGALGEKRAVGKLYGRFLGPSSGLLAPLRPVSGRLSPPGGAPGMLREIIFGGILGTCLKEFWAPRPRS